MGADVALGETLDGDGAAVSELAAQWRKVWGVGVTIGVGLAVGVGVAPRRRRLNSNRHWRSCFEEIDNWRLQLAAVDRHRTGNYIVCPSESHLRFGFAQTFRSSMSANWQSG